MTTNALQDLQQRDAALNAELGRGRLLSAYATFYRATSRGETPDDRARVVRFLQWADTFVGCVPVRNAVTDDRSYSEWVRLVPEGPTGPCVRLVARRWRDGRVVEERAIVRREIGKTA